MPKPGEGYKVFLD